MRIILHLVSSYFCLLLAVLFLLNGKVQAQDSGQLDTSFNPLDNGFCLGDGVGGYDISSVNSVAIQPDGKIIIGGFFLNYNGQKRQFICRLHPDGTLDKSFNQVEPLNGSVGAIALQADGKVVIGGNFSIFNLNYITRLLSDGTKDNTFMPSSGLAAKSSFISTNVFDIKTQSDGKILVGGSFAFFNNTPRPNIARFLADGSLDSDFNPGVGITHSKDYTQFYPVSYVCTVAAQKDDKVLIGGNFTHYNRISQNNFTRVNSNGTIDADFKIGSGANGVVKSIIVQPDGKILIMGDFTEFNNQLSPRIARLNSDGTLDTSFDPGLGANGEISAAMLYASGHILVVGKFKNFNDQPHSNIVRLSPNGSIDPTFAPHAGIKTNTPSVDAHLRAVTVLPNGKIIIGGVFTTVAGYSQNRIAQLQEDGTLDLGFNPSNGINGATTSTPDPDPAPGNYQNQSVVYKSLVMPNKKILLVGNFTSYRGTPRNNIAMLYPDGSLDKDFKYGSGLTGYSGGIHPYVVQTAALQHDGKILIGGGFSHFNGEPYNFLVRLNQDGTLDPTLRIEGHNTTGGSIMSIIPLADGRIFVTGLVINGINSFSAARLNSDGSIDPTFKQIVHGEWVFASALQPDNKILIGGNFITEGNNHYRKMARLHPDGTLDETFYQHGVSDPTDNVFYRKFVHTIALQPDNKILIGGNFLQYNGINYRNLARLQPNGMVDQNFNIGTGANDEVRTIALQPNGKILIGGEFTTFNDRPMGHLARLLPTGQMDSDFRSGEGASNHTRSSIETISFHADGQLIIGGSFTSYDGIGRNRVAKIFGERLVSGLPEIALRPTLHVYPNPYKDDLIVHLPKGITGNLQVTLVDGLGRIVYQNITKVTNEQRVISMQKNRDLPQGVYILQLTQAKNVWQTRLVKL